MNQPAITCSSGGGDSSSSCTTKVTRGHGARTCTQSQGLQRHTQTTALRWLIQHFATRHKLSTRQARGVASSTLPRQHLSNSSSSSGASKQQGLQEKCVSKLASTDGCWRLVQSTRLSKTNQHPTKEQTTKAKAKDSYFSLLSYRRRRPVIRALFDKTQLLMHLAPTSVIVMAPSHIILP